MTKKFLRKVIREHYVVTRRYAYWTWDDSLNGRLHIRRIDVDATGTTAALGLVSDTNPNGWETLKILSYDDVDRVLARCPDSSDRCPYPGTLDDLVKNLSASTVDAIAAVLNPTR